MSRCVMSQNVNGHRYINNRTVPQLTNCEQW